jgi:hypothetical protein
LYSLISLSHETYELPATEKGFDTIVRQNVIVTVDQVTTVNLALKVGSVNQVVTVTETTELMGTTTRLWDNSHGRDHRPRSAADPQCVRRLWEPARPIQPAAEPRVRSRQWCAA